MMGPPQLESVRIVPIMRVQIGDVQLFFDVDGSKLRPDRSSTRELPTLLLLHGGPGFDHSGFKPDFAQLTDIAQVVISIIAGADAVIVGQSSAGDSTNGPTTFARSAILS